MKKKPPQMMTVVMMVRLLVREGIAASQHDVERTIKRHGIEPTAMAGITRVFDQEAYTLVKYHLRNRKRGGVGCTSPRNSS